VRSQAFVRTSEWMPADIINVLCTETMGLATVASFLHTSVSMFDVLMRPWMQLIALEDILVLPETLSRASHGRPESVVEQHQHIDGTSGASAVSRDPGWVCPLQGRPE
jgi:hypothetical protein